VLFCCLVNDSSLRGGFLLNFLDDGQGMTQGKTDTISFISTLRILILKYAKSACSSC